MRNKRYVLKKEKYLGFTIVYLANYNGFSHQCTPHINIYGDRLHYHKFGIAMPYANIPSFCVGNKLDRDLMRVIIHIFDDLGEDWGFE